MIQSFADYVVYQLLGLTPHTRLGEAVNFFVYDTIKIIVLLALMIFVISIIRSFFPPEKTRQILSRHNLYTGHFMAAALGAVTPF